MTARLLTALLLTLALAVPPSYGWNNGQKGNTTTDLASECTNPPYSTHDWIADHALALLPDEEKAWLTPHKAIYLLGTEAPDNRAIAVACKTPNRGYDDRSKGHSIQWDKDFTKMTNDRAAVRAKEEYDKAVLAYRRGDPSAAAYFLGAMAHYIGDVGQYGHAIPDEKNHGTYETWVSTRTDSFSAGHFERYIELDKLVRRGAYTAVKRIALVTARGDGKILSGNEMDRRFKDRETDTAYFDSIGHALNLAVNELADVLHTFYLFVVQEED